jgi:hypothetical protein
MRRRIKGKGEKRKQIEAFLYVASIPVAMSLHKRKVTSLPNGMCHKNFK